MRVCLVALLCLCCFDGKTFDLEERFPDSHPTRAGTLSRLLSGLQQASWQWQRQGVARADGDCLYWQHEQLSATCVRQEGQHYYLHFWGESARETFEFVFTDDRQWTLKELLAFDVVAMAPTLEYFSSSRTGIWFKYHNNILSFKAPAFGEYELHIHTQSWGEGGLMQLVLERCSSCPAIRMRAFLSSDGALEYRLSNQAQAVSPRVWNEFMSSFESILGFMDGQLNVFALMP